MRCAFRRWVLERDLVRAARELDSAMALRKAWEVDVCRFCGRLPR
jgi:hypothetical protein